MMIRFCRCLFAVVLILTVGCTKRYSEKSVPLIMNDPYFNSFVGKGIKMAISFEDQSPSVSDTLWFDREGRLVFKSEIFSTTKYGYDSTGNLERILSVDDVPSNYLIDYRWGEEHALFQNWYPIKHLKWEFEPQDIDSVDRIVKLEFDDAGRLQEEVNLTIGEVTKYKYQGTKMSMKQVYSEGSDEPLLEWIYQYNDMGILNKIDCFKGETLLKEHFFSNEGILDSTKMNDYKLKFSYIYY